MTVPATRPLRVTTDEAREWLHPDRGLFDWLHVRGHSHRLVVRRARTSSKQHEGKQGVPLESAMHRCSTTVPARQFILETTFTASVMCMLLAQGHVDQAATVADAATLHIPCGEYDPAMRTVFAMLAASVVGCGCVPATLATPCSVAQCCAATGGDFWCKNARLLKRRSAHTSAFLRTPRLGPAEFARLTQNLISNARLSLMSGPAPRTLPRALLR